MSNQHNNPAQPPGGSGRQPEPSISKRLDPPMPPAKVEKDSTLNSKETLSVSSSTKALGITCPKCGKVNRPGVLVCENCGTLLINGEQAGNTKQFEEEQENSRPAVTETAEIFNAAVSTAGSIQFTENMILRLEIEEAPTPLLITPKAETTLGRRDPTTGTQPDVDLSAYAGYRLGVSRNHAVIRLKNRLLEIFDLGSSNGTSVNGVRLAPHQPHVLRDGDELMLGKMMIRVLFQAKNKRK